MGFKTLAIQKRSGEVWQLLGAVKTEFDKFGQGLSKMQQRLRQTDEELDNLIGVRTRAISRKLRSVQSLDEASASALLEIDDMNELPKALYVAVVITIVFAILKHTIGLRVTPEEEITGLDVSEHGLRTAYAGFAMLPDTAAVGTDAPAAVIGDVPAAEAIPVKRVPSFDTADGTSPKFTKVEIICKESKFEALKTAMLELGITGMTMSHVLGCGIQKGKPEYYRGVEVEATLLPKIQLDIVVSKVPVRSVIETAKRVLYTGHIGDGKIFVYDVENVVKVRTGEEDYDALQDVE